MAKRPGVPENAKASDETAVMASVKDGLPTILKFETQTVSVCGAAEGRSCTPTPIVTMRTERMRLCQDHFMLSMGSYLQ